MQRSPSHHAFTLIEMITVIAIIAILSGLVLSIGGAVQTKGYRAKAEGDKNALIAACEAYKTDNGGYPQDTVTNNLDPKASSGGNPASYTAASLYLYKQLSGDENANGQIDTAETGRKYAAEFFKPSRLNSSFKTTGIVTYIADPWGNAVGYSTAGLLAEQTFRAKLETDATAERTTTAGYNPTFDIWSTAGTTTGTDADKAKWIKNW